MLVNLKMLRTLTAVVKRGSFNAAADAVGCSPSAVSLQVKQLERFFGKPLFDRSTRQVVPTPFALDLCAEAGGFLARVDALRDRLQIAVTGRIRIGVITSMQSELMPLALHGLQNRHPGLDVVVAPLNDTGELLVELKAGRIDAALLVRPPTGGSSRLIWRDLYHQPFVMLVPAVWPRMSLRKVVETRPWIAYDTRLPAGSQGMRIVRDLKPDARGVIELRSMDAIVSMVSLGMGFSVMPRPRRSLLDSHAVREMPLNERTVGRQISMVWRQADDGNRNVAAVTDAFVEAADMPCRQSG